MRFKVNDTVISVGFGFTVTVFLITLTLPSSNTPVLLFIASLLHEAGHFAAIAVMGRGVDELKLTLCGAEIKEKKALNGFLAEAIIRICGPLLNLAVFIISFALSGSNDFARINLTLFAFNMLPVYSLDGGGALKSILCMFNDDGNADKTVTVMSFFVLIPLTIFGGLLLIDSKSNFTVLAAGVYLLILLLKER